MIAKLTAKQQDGLAQVRVFFEDPQDPRRRGAIRRNGKRGTGFIRRVTGVLLAGQFSHRMSGQIQVGRPLRELDQRTKEVAIEQYSPFANDLRHQLDRSLHRLTIGRAVQEIPHELLGSPTERMTVNLPVTAEGLGHSVTTNHLLEPSQYELQIAGGLCDFATTPSCMFPAREQLEPQTSQIRGNA